MIGILPPFQSSKTPSKLYKKLPSFCWWWYGLKVIYGLHFSWPLLLFFPRELKGNNKSIENLSKRIRGFLLSWCHHTIPKIDHRKERRKVCIFVLKRRSENTVKLCFSSIYYWCYSAASHGFLALKKKAVLKFFLCLTRDTSHHKSLAGELLLLLLLLLSKKESLEQKKWW